MGKEKFHKKKHQKEMSLVKQVAQEVNQFSKTFFFSACAKYVDLTYEKNYSYGRH